MTVVLDIGGEGNIWNRPTVSARPDHPIWSQATWFTLNLEPEKAPDLVDNAVTLAQVRDNSVDGIYSSHTIEHIDPTDSQTMFENWLRVLKPGGRMEIRCPDAEWTWKEYFSGRLPEVIITELLMGIRVGPLETHRNMWWENKLVTALAECGFAGARRINYGFLRPYLDFWPYDGKYDQYHGFRVIDLLVEAYKPPMKPSQVAKSSTDIVHTVLDTWVRNPSFAQRAARRVQCTLRPLMTWYRRIKAAQSLRQILV